MGRLVPWSGGVVASVGFVKRRPLLALGVAVAWTVFVWATRIRNALGDDSLEGGALAGVLLLSASFLAGSLVVVLAAVDAVRQRRLGERWPTTTLSVSVVVMAAWNAVVWASRMVGIATNGSHDFAFVAVHVVIGLSSIALWLVTVFSIFEGRSEEKSLIG